MGKLFYIVKSAMYTGNKYLIRGIGYSVVGGSTGGSFRTIKGRIIFSSEKGIPLATKEILP